jgi:Protein of unknown function (DUF3667)
MSDTIASQTTCKNCATSFEGKHCPACGQKASVKRIKIEDFYEDSIKKLTHWDKGLARTALDLVKNPGQMTLDFINGKRSKYTKPLSFLFLLSGVAFIFFSANDMQEGVRGALGKSTLDEAQKQYNQWIFDHMSLLTMFMIPFFAFFNRFFNRKADVNFAEHLVVVTYWLAGTLLVTIPFSCLFNLLKISVMSPESMTIQLLLSLLFYVWAYVVFFKKSNRFLGGLQGILAYLLGYIAFFIVITFAGGIVTFVLVKTGFIKH